MMQTMSTTVGSFKVSTTTGHARRQCGVSTTTVRASAAANDTTTTTTSSESTSPVQRRAMLTAVGAGLVALVSSRDTALAFGSGFPGYDMHTEARKRAEERNKREIQRDLEKAAAYRAALAAKKEEAAKAAASSNGQK